MKEETRVRRGPSGLEGKGKMKPFGMRASLRIEEERQNKELINVI